MSVLYLEMILTIMKTIPYQKIKLNSTFLAKFWKSLVTGKAWLSSNRRLCQ